MIRRGLQIIFVVGITALGAAPLHAQDATLYRSGFDVMLLTYDAAASGNGMLQWSSGGTTVRILDDPEAGYYFLQLEFPGEFVVTLAPNGRIGHHEGTVPQWVFSGSYEFEAAIPVQFYLPGIAAYFPDPYQEGFPDWSSAGVKIPLGFGFGLAAWASFLALGVPIRWVKELTNAAT